MATNINPETGIAYGYISANCLDQDVVTELMDNGENHTANMVYAEWLQNEVQEILDNNDTLSHGDALEEAEGNAQNFWNIYEDCEPTIEGCQDNVNYATSWLGGALNFFIFKSPHITEHARLASPCVPNAGILDTLDGNVQSYDVPSDWRRVDD